MSNARPAIRLLATVFTLLGFTSTLGAISHGNNPAQSIGLFVIGLCLYRL
jgi:hypothetical protein